MLLSIKKLYENKKKKKKEKRRTKEKAAKQKKALLLLFTTTSRQTKPKINKRNHENKASYQLPRNRIRTLASAL